MRIKRNTPLLSVLFCAVESLRDFIKSRIKMADKAVALAAKPQMRGLLNSLIKRNLIISLTLAGLSGIAFSMGIARPRKQRYAEFYRTYDAEKEFEVMRQKGLFQSC